jgi:serine/threonine protein phosphatase PrpC
MYQLLFVDAQLNQDNGMYEILLNPDGSQRACVAAVFDGHGLLGEQAASAAVNCLREYVLSPDFDPSAFLDAPEQSMKGLFSVLQAAVIAEHDNPPDSYRYPGHGYAYTFKLTDHQTFGKVYESKREPMPPAPIDFGCTAVVAVVYDGFACIGNAGDATAVLCGPEDDDPPAHLLTERHNATEKVEIARIERDWSTKAMITPDGYLAPLDPDLAQYEVQTTRCLGHRLLRAAGITSDPAVRLVKLNNARALVLCSDGISDELKPRDIADRVVDVSASEGAEALCRDAQEFCVDTTKVDDCTCVVLRFNN